MSGTAVPQTPFTSPRLRGEVDRAKRGRVRGSHRSLVRKPPLTPTLSPQAGRGSVRRMLLPLQSHQVDSALERRIVARIDRLLEELLLVVGPELADVVVGLDRLVPVLQAVFGPLLAKLPDVEVANHVAEMVELDRSARRVGEVDAPHRGH